MQAVIRRCGFPLAAPSANPANRLSPTTAEHVRQGLGDRIPLILDGGPCLIGIESTVLDLTATPPRILRPGIISKTALASVLGQTPTVARSSRTAGIRRSPGQFSRHYAPHARLLIWTWPDAATFRRRLAALGVRAERCHVIAHSRIPAAKGLGSLSVLPREPGAFARAMYAELHRCDLADAAVIVVEAPPARLEWHGILDRLTRAAA
jgi:L-threonylcarbamoyladenylate synthase